MLESEVINGRLSELEFEASTTNRNALKTVRGLRRLMKRHGMMYNPFTLIVHSVKQIRVAIYLVIGLISLANADLQLRQLIWHRHVPGLTRVTLGLQPELILALRLAVSMQSNLRRYVMACRQMNQELVAVILQVLSPWGCLTASFL